MTPTNSPTLFERMKEGDQDALKEWLARHRDLLKRWAARKGISPGHAGDSSDVVQNTQESLFKLFLKEGLKDGEIDTEAKLLKWLSVVLKHEAINQIRKNPKLIQLPSPGDTGASAGMDPLAQLVGMNSMDSIRDLREDRRKCITESGKGLTPSQIRIVTLHEVNGMPLKVIAEQLKLTSVNVAKEFYLGVSVVRGPLDSLAERHCKMLGESMREKLVRAMQSLPERQRQAVELKHLENPSYSLNEIAQIIGQCISKSDTESRAETALAEDSQVMECTGQMAGQLVFRGISNLRKVLVPVA